MRPPSAQPTSEHKRDWCEGNNERCDRPEFHGSQRQRSVEAFRMLAGELYYQNHRLASGRKQPPHEDQSDPGDRNAEEN